MSTESIITLLTSIGTFVSAIVALITVVEIRKQRKTTYRPELFLNDTHFEIKETPLLSNSDFLIFIGQFDMENLGFGVARIIQLEWKFDLHYAFNILTEHFTTDYTYKNNKGFLSFSKDPFFDSFSLIDLKPDIIDFIAPKVHNAKKTPVQIPHTIIKFFVYHLVFKNNLLSIDSDYLNLEEFEDIPAISLHIKYQDLNGDNYIKKYDVKVSALIDIGNTQEQSSTEFYYKFTEKYIT